MPSKNNINKKRKIIHRFRTRNTAEASVSQKERDIQLIDLVLKKLYNEGDKETASLNEDILKPARIQFTEAGSDRLWDLLLSTGLVNPVIGFGKSGNLTLTNDGYQLMTKFGSYSNFISEREKQAQAASNPGMVIPQFILSGGESEDEKGADPEQQEAKPAKEAKKPENPAAAAQKSK